MKKGNLVDSSSQNSKKSKGNVHGVSSFFLEVCGLLALVGLGIFFLMASWRKWPDPLIDFGQGLYIPWRLTHGAVLYRDVGHLYGPLSQYANALLFACFGTSFMVLVTANLLIFTAITMVIYVLCRVAWGVGAALAATAVFISVFGFSQFVGIGNYNYATPYTHETTHGVVVCLLLLLVLIRWIDHPTSPGSLIAGLLFGLTAVLKPEFLLAGGLVTLTAAGLSYRYGKWPGAGSMFIWVCGAALPTVVFTAYFSAFLPWQSAVGAACRGWLNAITTTRYSGYGLQWNFIGTDDPWKHFVEQTIATILAAMVIAMIAMTGLLTDRMQKTWTKLVIIGLLGLAMMCLACYEIDWIEIGRCLLGLTLIYTSFSVASVLGRKYQPVQVTRLLFTVLAASLMFRMILHGRIYQFGYYQAALAGLLIPALLVGELPERLRVG